MKSMRSSGIAGILILACAVAGSCFLCRVGSNEVRTCDGARTHRQRALFGELTPPVHHLRLLRDLAQDRCLARLGPGARRDALSLRLPASVIGVALIWPAVSPGAVRGEARKGFAQLEVAVPSLADITDASRRRPGGCDHRHGPA